MRTAEKDQKYPGSGWFPEMPVFPFLALVKKELLIALRQRRTFAMLALMTFAVLGMEIFLLTMHGGEEPSRGELSRFSRNMMASWTFIVLLASVMFLPGILSGAICLEKQRGSFEMLSVTLIRPSGLLLAKLICMLGMFLLSAVATLPALGVLFFFAGIDWALLFAVLALLGFGALAISCVGLLCSSFFNRPLAALFGSYFGAVCCLGLPPLLLAFGNELLLRRILRESIFNNFIRKSLECSLAPIVFFESLDGVEPMRVLIYCVIQSGYALIAFLIARWILRRPPRPLRVDQRKLIGDPGALDARRKRFPYYLIDPLRRGEPIGDRWNPMLIKELCAGLLRNMDWRLRIFFLSIAFAILLSFSLTGSSPERTLGFWLVLETFAILLIVPGIAGTAMPREYEQDNIDSLRVTLLTPRQIIHGKLFAICVAIAPIALGLLIGHAPVVLLPFLDPGHGENLFLALLSGGATMIVTLTMAILLGFFVSLFSRTTTHSVVSVYVATFTWAFVIPFAMLMALERHPARELILLCPQPAFVIFFATDRHFHFWEAISITMTIASILIFLLYELSVRIYARRHVRER